MKTRLAFNVLLAMTGLLLCSQLFAVQINISYNQALERYLPSINANERAREDNFRQTRLPNGQNRFNTLFTFNKERLHGTDWAGELLIDNVEDYTVDNLIRGFIEDNLSRFSSAAQITRIDVEIERVRVANYSLPRLGAGANTYTKGLIRWYDSTGRLADTTELTANLVNIPSLDRPYKGTKYAFGEPDQHNRIGPVLSYFIEQGLKDLFPDEQAHIHGPIFIRFANAVSSI